MSVWGRRLTTMATIVAGCGAVGAAVGLITDYVIAWRTIAAEQPRIDTLLKASSADAGAVRELADSYKRRTDASLARDQRTRWLSFGLIVCGAAFVASAGQLRSVIPPRPIQPCRRGEKCVAIRTRMRVG